jgi:predicted protein tyrosine phosphatase
VNVLFVCTGNVARSPAAELIFRELAAPDTRHATRSVGTGWAAVRRLTTREMAWADVVAVMERAHVAHIQQFWPDHARKVRILNVPDDYDPSEGELHAVLREKIKTLLDSLADLARRPAISASLASRTSIPEDPPRQILHSAVQTPSGAHPPPSGSARRLDDGGPS